MPLARELHAIYHLEIRLGNTVDYIAKPAGSACPDAVAFEQPLHKAQAEAELSLPEAVRYWESHDAHYPIEAGYQCAITRRTLAGPIQAKSGKRVDGA